VRGEAQHITLAYVAVVAVEEGHLEAHVAVVQRNQNDTAKEKGQLRT
jgi:hypothetical protein